MNKDIFSKKYTILWIIVLLLYAVICASFFFVFLSPLSNTNVAEAEVSSLQTNTDYYFSSFVVNTRWAEYTTYSTYSGTVSFEGMTVPFTKIGLNYTSSNNQPVRFGLSFTTGVSGNPYCGLEFNYSNYSFYSFNYSYGGSYHSGLSSSYVSDNVVITFNSLGSETRINNIFLRNFSIVPSDHRPDLRGLYNYELNGIYTSFDFNTQTTSYSTYTNDLYVFEVYNLDSTQLNAVGTSFYTFEIAYSAGHYNVSTDTYTTNSGTFTGYAPYSPSPIGYITIAVDLSYWNLFSLYYPEYSNDDDNQLDISYDDSETNLLWRQIKANYDSIHDMNNDSRSTRSAYLQGYEAGSNADKTLLSVMWQTFNLPFRLLFGTYDDVQSSPTYGQYVGGLFNFTILGVDIRAFCIGIMSFAIVLAVVRFIIGIKG